MMKITASQKRLISYLPVIFIISTGIILSVMSYTLISRTEMKKIKAEFRLHSNHRINAIKTNLNRNREILQSLKSFFNASEEVTRDEFGRFTSTILSGHPEIQALEWIPKVKASERQKYEDAAKADGYTGFSITERESQGNMISAGARDEYYPVYFIEPYKDNENALGFDLASNPVRFEALQKAGDTGKNTVTGQIILVQERKEGYGFLKFIPVYRKGAVTETVEDRRENLAGFILGVFRIKDIVKKALLQFEPAGIDIVLADESAPPEGKFLYYHPSRMRKNTPPGYGETEDTPPFFVKESFQLADRRWSLTTTPYKNYLETNRWNTWPIPLSIIVITILTALYFIRGTRQKIQDKMHIKEIKIEEERWENTFNSITDPVSVHDTEMRIVKANKAFSDLLGLTPDEVKGRYCYELVHRTDKPVPECPLTETYKTGKTVTKEIFEPRLNLHLLVTSSPLIEEGNIISAVHYIKDITGQIKAMKELENLNKEFEQLIHTTSHDLRSPLVNIEGYQKEISYSLEDLKKVLKDLEAPDRAGEKIKTIIDKEIPQAVRYINASICKMDSLLSALLKLSRTSRIELRKEKLNMNDLIKEVVSALEHTFKTSEARYEIFELPVCIGDKEQMNRLFTNLIGNALKYLDPERQGIIKISGLRKDREVLYCIEDNGIGISADDREKIFELFHQLRSGSEGEGLGLSIVRKVVQRHNGKIWVESEEGRGSRFFISLPYTGQPETESQDKHYY